MTILGHHRADRFCHLTVATSYSIGRAVGMPSSYVRAAAASGAGAIAISEYHSLRSLRDVAKAAKEDGVVAVPSVRLLWCPNAKARGLSQEDKAKVTAGLPPSMWADAIKEREARLGVANVRDLGYVTIWALDNEAMIAMYEVASRAWIDGFYYQPRVDCSILSAMRGRFAMSVGGWDGPVAKYVEAGRTTDALALFESLRACGATHVEVSAMPLFAAAKWNAWIAANKPEWARPILTHPVCYLGKTDSDYQQVIEVLDDPMADSINDGGLPGTWWYFATLDELREWSSKARTPWFEEAATETTNITDACSAVFVETPNACITPALDLGDDKTPRARLERLARERIHLLNPEWPPEYEARLAMELDALEKQGFCNYLLYVNDIIAMARSLGIAIGPGRGSAAGCLVLWLLGVTSPHIDPIAHGLLFSRFVDPKRVAPPDVDFDVDNTRRPELIEAMRQRYGAESVAHISNFMTMRGRGYALAVMRALGVPLGPAREFASTIDSEADVGAVEAAFTSQNGAARAIEMGWPSARRLMLGIEGNVRSLGIHAGGVVCSPGPLWQYIPIETRAHDKGRMLVTAFDMLGTEATGLLKVDALGLKTVHLLSSAEKTVRRLFDPDFSLDKVPLDDKRTLDAFTAGDFSGIFQYDTALVRRWCEGITFTCFADVSTMTALIRPGPLDCGMAAEFIKRKKGETEVVVDYHEVVSEITRDTLGVIVYQEQIMAVADRLCRYPNPDVIRKMVGKKMMDALVAEGPEFIRRAMEHSDITQDKAQFLWDSIVTAGRYVFNKSHSDAYALIAYLSQYIKAHYPAAFYEAALNIESDGGAIRTVVGDALAHNVPILPPDVNESGDGFAASSRGVLCSLTHLRGVGDAATAEIIAKRPFTSFDDFMTRINRRAVNVRCVRTLAAAGAFDCWITNRRAVVDGIEAVAKDMGRKRRAYTSWLAGCEAEQPEQWDETRLRLEEARVNPAMGDDPFATYLRNSKVSPWPTELWRVDGTMMWLSGCVADMKIETEGRFGDRDTPEAAARKGCRFIVCRLVNGDHSIRVKVAWSEYERHTWMAEGMYVAVLGQIDSKYATLRASVVVDLASELDSPTLWGACLMGQNPLAHLSRQGKPDRWNWCLASVMRQAMRGDFSIVPVAGIVTYIRPRFSAKGEEMGFIGVLHPSGACVDITVFSHRWNERVIQDMEPGDVVSIDAEINWWKERCSWVFGRQCTATIQMKHDALPPRC